MNTYLFMPKILKNKIIKIHIKNADLLNLYRNNFNLLIK